MTEEKIFVWVGFFNDQRDFDQYIAQTPGLEPDKEVEDDEEAAMSLFCEDIDLPQYDEAFAKGIFLADQQELPKALAKLFHNPALRQTVDTVLHHPNRPPFNALLLINAHASTRYYRGGARPGAPIRFVGCFEDL
ncbi:immunity 22 family protein [uncultured Microscilla sp.]|uniref:immunity 22 family protein n=1 Tax=uncultured Microscilla sp. TaxID=432653 RepID=UPI00260A9BCD|nr:immunity 22 family protein [uncultured Microscilla sp.]